MDQSFAMRLFVRVVEEESFSKAGSRMGIAQSSASRYVAALETELGTQLLQRSTRKLNLTEAGRIYYERARRIVVDIDDVYLAVRRLSDDPSGVLRVATPASFGRRHIAPLLAEFYARYPKIKIGLSLSDSIQDVIGEGFDLAIRFGKLVDSSLIAKRLTACRSVVCAHPEYIKETGAPREPDDLERHNCLTFRALPGQNIWHFERKGEVFSVSASGSLYADSGDALLAAAVSRLGIVHLPSWVVAADIEGGRLVPLLEDYTVMPKATPIHAVFAHNRHLAPKVRVFVDFLNEKFADRNW
jgi:DNA-binding transcriptional LysR family regulator